MLMKLATIPNTKMEKISEETSHFVFTTVLVHWDLSLVFFENQDFGMISLSTTSLPRHQI
jgi:hypothetical protein